MTDIDKVAAEAREMLKGISSTAAKHDKLIVERNEAVRPLLRQVHDAIVVRKETVEGCATWTDWATQAGWSKRMLEFIRCSRLGQQFAQP